MTQSKRQHPLNFAMLVTIKVLLKVFVQNMIRKRMISKRQKHNVKLTQTTSQWTSGRRGHAVKTFLMQ